MEHVFGKYTLDYINKTQKLTQKKLCFQMELLLLIINLLKSVKNELL